MTRFCLLFLILGLSSGVDGQSNDKFREGYFIDKNGNRYNGWLLLEPGDGKKTSELVYRESRNSKKEFYNPGYVQKFVIAADSFGVIQNFPLANRKTMAMDFARVIIVGDGGVLYQHQTEQLKSSGHAAADFQIEQDKFRYLIFYNNKFIPLTQHNMKDLAPLMKDHAELSKKLAARKIRFSQLETVVEEYRQFKKGKTRPE